MGLFPHTNLDCSKIGLRRCQCFRALIVVGYTSRCNALLISRYIYMMLYLTRNPGVLGFAMAVAIETLRVIYVVIS